MIFLEQLLWIIYPYIVITVFILGLFLRYNNDQRGWSSKSSELLEKNLLKWGSTLFHIGIIFAFLGHVAGIIVPLWFYRGLGVSDEQYHIMATIMGGLAGLASCIGLAILVYRRFMVTRVRMTSSFSDLISILLLLLVVFNGMLVTIVHSINPAGFDYRASLAPWFRGILTLKPDVTLMMQVPILFKFHVFTAFLFFALMPFTRMVHIISQPVTYIFRSYIVYRKRS
ncbi:respiratory nitrate reductase subunit gamma [Clostridium paridis]|uniref:Respiratory nitrate reductase subunit gamma n=1 Tax=Clostridium paridis TaxID=2803863 RepID=A0A937FKA7_9CLOT|nr:respiratory nitrate reductase subunit gamma [Clostridium paridis]MBL4933306.1 respiratory nitrate reductase subunit gamma [Clostridium paridis]